MVSYLVFNLPRLAAGAAASMGVSLISKDKSSSSNASSISSSSSVSSKSRRSSPLICGANAVGMISSGASGIITETDFPSDFNLLPLGITGTTAVFFSAASSFSSSSSSNGAALGSGTRAPASSQACTTGFSSSRVNGTPTSELSFLLDLKLKLGALNTGLKRHIK